MRSPIRLITAFLALVAAQPLNTDRADNRQSPIPAPQPIAETGPSLTQRSVEVVRNVPQAIINAVTDWFYPSVITCTPEKFKRLLSQNYQFPPKVIVTGRVVFINDPVRSLPTGLEIHGKLEFIRCPHLESLPAGLVVHRGIEVDNCPNLSMVSAGVTVHGDMYLKNCESLTSIGDGLIMVGGFTKLSVINCRKFTTLPANLKVDILKIICGALRTLPPGLVVSCLDLTGCRNLTSLPEDLRLKGGLNLRWCIGLISLPSWITTLGQANGDPTVVDITRTGLFDALIDILRQTPAPGMQFLFSHGAADSATEFSTFDETLTDWVIEANFNTRRALPRYIVRHDVASAANNRVGEIPNSDSSFSMTCDPTEFYKLVSQNFRFPPKVIVTQNLNGRNESLPAGLEVHGNLNLTGSFFTSLPEGLNVEGNLNISWSPGLISLPQHLKVGGDLILQRCPRLTSLPNWITTLGPRADGRTRTVDISGTGISNALIERLRQTPTPGMRFIFAHEATEPTTTFSTLDEALTFWVEAAKGEAPTVPQFTIDQEHLANALRFLARLTTTAEYQNLQTRPFLAYRILEALNQMALDPEVNTRACYLIGQGLTSCDDRIISAFEEIELMLLLDKIENTDHTVDELRKLGKSFMLLEMVNAKAKVHKDSLTWVDEIEVYLAFQIGLTDRFNLPVKTKNMIFRRCAQVTDAQLRAYGDEIEAAYTDEKLEAYLKTWSPWMKNERLASVPAYANLELDPRPISPDDTCIITQEVPVQPVRYAGNVYEYEAFVKWYVDKRNRSYDTLTDTAEPIKKINQVPLHKMRLNNAGRW